jgi:hypothetical protein
MTRECTDLFLHYREIARLTWNLGFWPMAALREYECLDSYQTALARLFEGMIIFPIGREDKVTNPFSPGDSLDFTVVVTSRETEWFIERNPAERPSTVWKNADLVLNPNKYRFRFVSFFDWTQLAIRDFKYLRVKVDRMDDRIEYVNREALIEIADCEIFFVDGTEESGFA